MAIETASSPAENSALECDSGEQADEARVPGWYEQWPESAERSTLAIRDEERVEVPMKGGGGRAAHTAASSRVTKQYVDIDPSIFDIQPLTYARQHSAKTKGHIDRSSKSRRKGTYF